jgi:hypothetical protein
MQKKLKKSKEDLKQCLDEMSVKLFHDIKKIKKPTRSFFKLCRYLSLVLDSFRVEELQDYSQNDVGFEFYLY